MTAQSSGCWLAPTRASRDAPKSTINGSKRRCGEWASTKSPGRSGRSTAAAKDRARPAHLLHPLPRLGGEGGERENGGKLHGTMYESVSVIGPKVCTGPGTMPSNAAIGSVSEPWIV